MRIFTGAPMPDGSDAVVMQEDVTLEAGGVRFPRMPEVGANVRRRGEDIGAGQVALAGGTILGPAQLALLASLDRARVAVVGTPHVLVLPTGDELRLPGTVDRPGSIAESNGVAIASMARRLGATSEVLPAAGDDDGVLDRALTHALPRADLLVTIGGVSVGDHDLVRPALERAGVKLSFYKVRMKPGKPLTLGRHAGGLVLGLPGNPASAMVTFGLFGGIVLFRMAGRDAGHTTVRARLGAPVRRKAGRRELLRAVLADGVATPLANQASGAVVAMARANALVSVPEDVAEIAAGAEVIVYPFEGLGL
jgi:molybdopterin molybdotransferase